MQLSQLYIQLYSNIFCFLSNRIDLLIHFILIKIFFLIGFSNNYICIHNFIYHFWSVIEKQFHLIRCLIILKHTSRDYLIFLYQVCLILLGAYQILHLFKDIITYSTQFCLSGSNIWSMGVIRINHNQNFY